MEESKSHDAIHEAVIAKAYENIEKLGKERFDAERFRELHRAALGGELDEDDIDDHIKQYSSASVKSKTLEAYVEYCVWREQNDSN